MAFLMKKKREIIAKMAKSIIIVTFPDTIGHFYKKKSEPQQL